MQDVIELPLSQEPPVVEPQGGGIPVRKRLKKKQAAPEIRPPVSLIAPLADVLPLPVLPDEVIRVRKQLYHQLSKFRTRQWGSEAAIGPLGRRRL